VLNEVDQASFAEHWGFRPMSLESFNEELHGEDWDPSLVFIAQASGTTVGYVVSFLFEMCGYVGSLGVLKESRGRGIGKALLRRTFAELVGRGSREVRLGVDAQNVHGAVALYESVGMSVSSLRRVRYWDQRGGRADQRSRGELSRGALAAPWPPCVSACRFVRIRYCAGGH
jgi:ribosomal protein S18 acetylase RimI-like enzyme